jgi:tyrosine-protein phosphatase
MLISRQRLIYQLLDYERALQGGDRTSSPTPSDRSSLAVAEDEEWGRRRAMMEEALSDVDDNDRNSIEVAREARALDRAMEDRIVARKSSSGSVSSLGSGIGMGQAWKSRYMGRRRAGSVASGLTDGSSNISEDLVEEDEEMDLLGVGGGFDAETNVNSPESQYDEDGLHSISSKKSIINFPPPSAPVSRPSFVLPRVPATATQAVFDLSTPRTSKHRPPPLPIKPLAQTSQPVQILPRTRADSRKPDQPSARHRKPSQPLPTPSQTLFVFPPSNISTQAPSTMILTPSVSNFVPFPSISAPRVSTRKSHGRRTSFIGVGPPATPTTAFSRVDARGWVGMD